MHRTLRLLVLLLILASTRGVIAEGLPDPAMEALKQQQARQEEERITQEMEAPKVVEVAKDRAVLGPKKAPILIVVYSDFQCPYCSRGADTVEAVRKKYGNKVRYVFKHMPLNFHPQALPAARYFEAIALQSPAKAYAFHDLVFKEQTRLGSEGIAFLDEVTTKVKADLARVKKDVESPKVHNRLQADIEEAKGLGISGTPAFNIAGVTLKGAYPIEYFERIIDHRLAKRGTAGKKKG